MNEPIKKRINFKFKKSDIDFKVKIDFERHIKKECEDCKKGVFLESLKILSSLPLPKISSKRVIEKYGEDFLIEALATCGINSIDISEKEMWEIFIKRKLVKKSWLKPSLKKRLKI